MAEFFSVTATLQETALLCPPNKAETPPLTPFSAVVPARFIAVSRLNIHITLETIHEDIENDEEEEISQLLEEVSQTSSSSSTTSFLSTCFSEVLKKPIPLFSHNCRCAQGWMYVMFHEPFLFPFAFSISNWNFFFLLILAYVWNQLIQVRDFAFGQQMVRW